MALLSCSVFSVSRRESISIYSLRVPRCSLSGSLRMEGFYGVCKSIRGVLKLFKPVGEPDVSAEQACSQLMVVR